MTRATIAYVTSSEYKREEWAVIEAECRFSDGSPVGDSVQLDIRPVQIKETLEVDIEEMVQQEVKSAYAQLKVPCMVEHAGLVFADYGEAGYPGGLTKPMWNTLGERFVDETRSANRSAFARAVVAYCDGMSVFTFTGETEGTIAAAPRGSRQFYWDTVFVPRDHNPDSLTYAELVDDQRFGLRHKVLQLSQSRKAIMAFLEWRRNSPARLWQVVH